MIKLDEYGEVLNGRETYKGIAEAIKGGTSMLIGWTDGEGSHYDILFTRGAVMPLINSQTIQGGIRAHTDLFVSIMRKGAFAFDINNTKTSAGYYAQKLTLNDMGSTADALADLINGVKYALYKLVENE